MAAAEHMNILPNYIKWTRKTKETLNLSQLVADHIPSNAAKNQLYDARAGLHLRAAGGALTLLGKLLPPLNFNKSLYKFILKSQIY